MNEPTENLSRLNTEWQTPENREQECAAAFQEWCRLNSIANPDLYSGINHFDAVFRDGSNKLMTELRDPHDNELKLVDKLDLPGLKSELDVLRTSGDIAVLGQREAEIANLIQQAISEYPYESSTCHTAQILNKKEINCVGASVLGGRLLDELGIKYLVGNIGSHVLLIVVTSDRKVMWQDMQDGKEINLLSNEELTAEKIQGKKADGENITPEDIVAYADNPHNEGMTFFVKKEHWDKKQMKVLSPELGLELNVLINTGFMLGNEGKNKEAIEILQAAKQKALNNSDVYLGLARANKNLGQYHEAIYACSKAIEIDPADSYLQDVLKELRSLTG